MPDRWKRLAAQGSPPMHLARGDAVRGGTWTAGISLTAAVAAIAVHYSPLPKELDWAAATIATVIVTAAVSAIGAVWTTYFVIDTSKRK